MSKIQNALNTFFSKLNDYNLIIITMAGKSK